MSFTETLQGLTGKPLADCTNQELYLALLELVRQKSADRVQPVTGRKLYYISAEFLIGKLLSNNLINLGLYDEARDALAAVGKSLSDIEEVEPEPSLGNGGLGRLAACYLDSMTTLEIPATGYSICYELGIFKQKIVEGQQVELPDDWMQLGDAWLLPKLQEAEEVHFGGKVRTRWDNNHLMVVHEDYTRVLAIPCDMEIAGYDTDHVNTLRLWQARSPKPIDMKLFSEGQYLHAAEERAMADAISQVLYPEDNHYEGKSLRLKQQYFFVSATIQSITRKHIQQYGTLRNFHEKNVIQINDTHPALVIPELMRVLMDDAGLDWDTAWNITTHSVAYTNHTALSEALERFPCQREDYTPGLMGGPLYGTWDDGLYGEPRMSDQGSLFLQFQGDESFLRLSFDENEVLSSIFWSTSEYDGVTYEEET